MASCCSRTTTSRGKKLRIWSSQRATRGSERPFDRTVRPAFRRRFPLVAADFLVRIACVDRLERLVHFQLLGRQRAAGRRHPGHVLLRVLAQDQTPTGQLFLIEHGGSARRA